MSNEGFPQWKPLGNGKIKIEERRIIGEGSQSKIYRYDYRGTYDEKIVAVKAMLGTNLKEVEILRNLEHENIIKYKVMEEVDPVLYIVLELCHCSLKQYVEGENHYNITLTPIEVLKQITEGVHYLHNGQSYCTVHRDLKPSNILFLYVERELSWKVKISDFGISKEFDPMKSSTKSKLKGSPGYIAPELLDGSNETGEIRKETDIFSLGIIFYFTLSNGKHPFSNDPHDVNAKVRDADPSLDELHEEYKDSTGALIKSMICKDWKKRININDIKAHHIFWNAKKILDYFQIVSDGIEDRVSHQKLINVFEEKRKEIAGENWVEKLSNEDGKPKIKETLTKRSKNKISLQDLLRQIRNWGHHYNDKGTSVELREELGDFPDGFIQYFTSRFPKLLPHTYEVFKEMQNFKEFYGASIESTVTVTEGAEAQCKSAPIHDVNDDHEVEDSYDLLSLDDEPNSGLNQDNESELILREYQKELAEQALAGHNSLIIAPTGSGKTAVANEIIKHHLKKEIAKSVLFFVSKTTLARQQYDYFKRHLKGVIQERQIAYLIGENTTNYPIGAIMKKMKLTVLTPQILIDELRRKKGFISFKNVTLMIFDECHNATGRHPYKIIMEMLYDYQMNNDVNTLPAIQIVGMTASPGVGKGKTREKVLENLIGLLANLNITQCPSVVEQNIEELKRHQNEIDESFIKVPLRADVFTRKIQKAIQIIENRIRDKGVFGSESGKFEEPPEDKSKQIYEHWTVQLIHHVKLKVHDNEPSRNALARTVVTYAEHLKMYYNLLYYKRLIPDAINVTNEFASFDQDGEQGKFLRKINSELRKAAKDEIIPMLDKLFAELKSQFTKNRDSHCIIFVPRKRIASALVDCIKRDDQLGSLEPVFLTGSNKQGSTEGMTKTKQDSSLNAFRKHNNCKILIATSVAEEGLDIRACNLVIMYNYVTGEVGRIQRAGRGRAENSRSVLIVPYGSEQFDQEIMNAVCAEATEVAIEDLKELSNEQRTMRIKRIQRREYKERIGNITPEKIRLQEASKWQILCAKCQAFLTTADQLRRIKNQHVFVMDEKFKNRVSRRHFSGEPREIAPGVISVGQFECRDPTCRSYVGLEMLHKNQMYPTLTVKQLIFQDVIGNRKITKQWTKCPFKILEMEDDDEEGQNDEDVASEVENFLDSQAKSEGGIKEMEASNLSQEEAVEITNID